MEFLKLTHTQLSVEEISNLVSTPTCGAISIFVGTTRNNFEGKSVINLEYEAYESMALKSLQSLCNDIRSQWKAIENIAIYHRLGTVPVKEASIVIAISSPHRLDAMQAVQWCIDNVKKSVPIWKKEIYEGQTDSWKENKESSIHPPRVKFFKLNNIPEVKVPFVPPHLVQIKADGEEIEKRIEKFIELKREEINRANIRDFCCRDDNEINEFSCARIDAKLIKRKDSKGHLKGSCFFVHFAM
uniref:Molybdopterin synthase catalytic subunit n=1 Tax=Photinus pyralis TaxID=7054 RepID=A0A1Y1NF28_PHOPY